MTGCAANGTSRALQQAADTQGKVDAGIEIPRQPRECGEPYELLPREELVGHEAMAGIDRYEQFITDEVNPTKRRCWQFNENIRKGLSR